MAQVINLDALEFDRWDARFPPDQKPPLER